MIVLRVPEKLPLILAMITVHMQALYLIILRKSGDEISETETRLLNSFLFDIDCPSFFEFATLLSVSILYICGPRKVYWTILLPLMLPSPNSANYVQSK